MIIAGDPEALETRALISAAQRSFCPNLVLIVEDATCTTATGNGNGNDDNKKQQKAQNAEGVEQEAPLFRDVLEASGGGYAPGEGGQAAAYVCFDNACSRPVHTVEALKKLL